MERTQKLLGIALAVLALDGCRGASTQQASAPGATSTPWVSSHRSSWHHIPSSHYGSHFGSYAAGAAAAAAAAGNRRGGTIDRTLGGSRWRGGFGAAGARGGFGG
jgi:hypothetical protein